MLCSALWGRALVAQNCVLRREMVLFGWPIGWDHYWAAKRMPRRTFRQWQRGEVMVWGAFQHKESRICTSKRAVLVLVATNISYRTYFYHLLMRRTRVEAGFSKTMLQLTAKNILLTFWWKNLSICSSEQRNLRIWSRLRTSGKLWISIYTLILNSITMPMNLLKLSREPGLVYQLNCSRNYVIRWKSAMPMSWTSGVTLFRTELVVRVFKAGLSYSCIVRNYCSIVLFMWFLSVKY